MRRRHSEREPKAVERMWVRVCERTFVWLGALILYEQKHIQIIS